MTNSLAVEEMVKALIAETAPAQAYGPARDLQRGPAENHVTVRFTGPRPWDDDHRAVITVTDESRYGQMVFEVTMDLDEEPFDALLLAELPNLLLAQMLDCRRHTHAERRRERAKQERAKS